MRITNAIFRWIEKHTIFGVIVITIGFSLVFSFSKTVMSPWNIHGQMTNVLISYLPLCILQSFPLSMTFLEFVFLLKEIRGKRVNTIKKVLSDFITIGYLSGGTWLYMLLFQDVSFSSEYFDQLYNHSRHSPFAQNHLFTIIVLLIAAVVGYSILTGLSAGKLTPLIGTFSISALYIGVVLAVVITIQVWSGNNRPFLILLLLNIVLIMLRTVRLAVLTWRTDNSLIQKRRRAVAFFEKSERWPLLGLIFVIPLWGVIMAFLLLFGQEVDSVIRAFTETADWNLSLRDAPENINMISNDMHYLCTVAASGHSAVVKPQRLGVRHKHVVVVNRQLCVANAFEQILEEKMPRLHKNIRYIYDHSGIHLAKMVRSKYTADAVYILMKPAEWLFLGIIYMVDVHPENRIAIQYTGKGLKDFEVNQAYTIIAR